MFTARKNNFTITTSSAVEAENLRSQGYEVTEGKDSQPAQHTTETKSKK